jgi:hypothetical protein
MAFDISDGDLIFGGDDIGFDSDGHMMQNLGGGMAMDMDTGDLHIVSGWDDEDDDDI